VVLKTPVPRRTVVTMVVEAVVIAIGVVAVVVLTAH
jgi:hypothetical protein